LTGYGQEGQQKHQGEDDDAWRSSVIDHVHKQENDHHQKAQHGLSVLNRSQRRRAGKPERFRQRNKVKHHSQIGGVERDSVQEVAGAGECHQRIEQANGVAA
jgi:hypothetical protein